MISRLLLILIPLSILLSACDGEKTRRLPRHSGAPGEVLLVMNEDQWLGAPGDSLRAVLEAYVQHLPQAEPRFSLLQFSEKEMSDLLKHHRNIIQVKIGSQYAATEGVKVARDQWSSHQLVFTITAGSKEAFNVLLNDHLHKIAGLIDDTEIDRYVSKYARFNHEEIGKKVADKFDVVLNFPEDCEIAKSTNDFMWIKRERIKYIANEGHQITQGFFVYKYPYTSDTAFSQASILAMRDSLLKMYVPGPSEGSYMTTEYRFAPESETATIADQYAVMTSGLWRTENDFMGGPFRSLTTTINDNESLICISGFVFAPKFDKREYIREVQAVLNSFKIEQAK